MALDSLAIGALFVPASALADEGPLVYLSPSSVNVSSLLSPPSALGTPSAERELDAMHAIQKTRTATDCVRAGSEVTATLDSFFGPAHGPLTAAEVSKLSALFSVLVPETKYFANEGKKIWHRARPYDEDRSLTPCIALDPTWSYPSGHAAVARAFAVILSSLYPERWLALTTRADQIAFDRVVGGVHHQSDISAGEALGDAVAQALLQNDKFNADLAAAFQRQN